jgi:Na+/H+ antiporter NhaA
MDDNNLKEIILKLVNMIYIRIMAFVNEVVNFKGLNANDTVKIVIVSIIIGMFCKGFMLISSHNSILKNKSI